MTSVKIHICIPRTVNIFAMLYIQYSLIVCRPSLNGYQTELTEQFSFLCKTGSQFKPILRRKLSQGLWCWLCSHNLHFLQSPTYILLAIKSLHTTKRTS